MQTHLHLYLSLYVSMYVYFFKLISLHSNTFNSNPAPQGSLQPSSFHICKLSPTVRNLTPMILSVFIYLLNLPVCSCSIYHVGCLLSPGTAIPTATASFRGGEWLERVA